MLPEELASRSQLILISKVRQPLAHRALNRTLYKKFSINKNFCQGETGAYILVLDLTANLKNLLHYTLYLVYIQKDI